MKRLKSAFKTSATTLSDGAKEYLGTERERIEGALTAKQIYKKQGREEVEKWVSIIREGEMRLNSDLDYMYLIPYIQLAIQYKIPYIVVESDELETNIGLIIAHACAVDKDSIWLKDEKKSEGTAPLLHLNGKLNSFSPLRVNTPKQ
ncbi:DUF1694 domain-containing protein [Bacillus sp. PK3_68]|uniref:DUF1694 domain-containing protein n=1 Tax=Bacillus sp. PK3_68 TaxID=2027408 RepID=UPI0015FED112|nr:DUF1694 domain-containing protein [Bacillus sp. PK3_68]